MPAAEDKSTQPRLNYRALSNYRRGDVHGSMGLAKGLLGPGLASNVRGLYDRCLLASRVLDLV